MKNVQTYFLRRRKNGAILQMREAVPVLVPMTVLSFEGPFVAFGVVSGPSPRVRGTLGDLQGTPGRPG